MSLTKEEVMNEAFDAGLITLGAVGASFVSKKVFKDNLGVPFTPNGALKQAAAVASGTMLIQYLQKQEIIPDDPFKKSTST